MGAHPRNDAARWPVDTSDIESTYAEAQRRGYEIVHPLTVEEWGVRRFFVRDPNGIVVNMVEHFD